MKQTFDRHMSTLFDQPSQSGAAFAGERRFSKSRGLSASVSFLPFPLPPLSFFWLLFHFSRGQNLEYRSSVFLCSETKRKRLLRRLALLSFAKNDNCDPRRLRDQPQKNENNLKEYWTQLTLKMRETTRARFPIGCLIFSYPWFSHTYPHSNRICPSTRTFRAGKRSAQATAHPLSQAQVWLFCVLTVFDCLFVCH